MPLAAMARASPPTGGSGGDEAAVLEGAAALRRCGATGAAVARAALLVEAVEPVLAVDAGEVGVADRRGVSDQPLLEARPRLRGW